MICFGRLGLVEFKQITNKSYAEYIFTQGYLTGDRNSYNHSSKQFESSWGKWLSFFVLYDNADPVAFCGIRDFGKYARIFDRYMVLPKFRGTGLSENSYIKFISLPLVESAIKHNKIPFFSIERENRRRSMNNATRVLNESLTDYKFHVLPGMYETVLDSWQHISIIDTCDTIDLNHRELQSDVE